MTLKTVDVPIGDYGHYAVEGMIENDREATLTALVTALEGERDYTDMGGEYFEGLKKGNNKAIDQAISIVKQLLTPTI